MKRVALIGLGRVAERIHLPALRALGKLELIAACEPDGARRAQLGAKFSIPNTYATLQEMFAVERPDLVIIGTPPAQHAEHALLALQNGADVFCEKPFVETIEQADAIIAAARRAQRRVAVNNQYRYMSIYRETARRLQAGEFGALYYLHAWQQMYHPPEVESGWRARLRDSTLFEFGTHVLDLLVFFFGALPSAVSAQMPRVRADMDADLLDLVQLQFPGERAATLTLNRLSRAPQRYLEMQLECLDAAVHISLGGVAYAGLELTRARKLPLVRAAFARGGEARVERQGRSIQIAREANEPYTSATATHLADFLRDLEAQREPQNSAEHARSLIQIVRAAYDSARTGQTIQI